MTECQNLSAVPTLSTIRNVTSGYDRKPDKSSDGGDFAWRRAIHKSKVVLHSTSWIMTHLDMSTRFDALTRHAKSPPSLLSSGFRSFPLVTFLIVAWSVKVGRYDTLQYDKVSKTCTPLWTFDSRRFSSSLHPTPDFFEKFRVSGTPDSTYPFGFRIGCVQYSPGNWSFHGQSKRGFLPDSDVFTYLNLGGLNWGKLKTVGTPVFTSYFAPFSKLRGIGGMERQHHNQYLIPNGRKN